MSGRVEPTADGLDHFEVIQQWHKLSPEHMKAAMKVFEAQLARNHELRMEQVRSQDAEARRKHALFMTGMLAGFTLVIAVLSGAVLLAMQGQTLLPAILTSLSLSIATIFVLRKHDPKQLRAVAQAQARIARVFPPLPGQPPVDALPPTATTPGEGAP